MNITPYASADAFLAVTAPYLAQHDVEHNVLLSLCRVSAQKPAAFYVAAGEDGIMLSSGQMPARNLVLSKGDMTAVDALADQLVADKASFPGIVGPSDVTAAFADSWTQKTGQRYVEYMDQIIYALDKVIMPLEVDGHMRLAVQSEAPLIATWIYAFAQDALPKIEQLTKDEALIKAIDAIAEGRLYVWDVNGVAVSQAFVSGTDHIARVAMVYTPPEQRNRGYACILVARVSQTQLDEGKKRCCLYADARNSVSNAIYRKIGYAFVGRSSLYVLEKP